MMARRPQTLKGYSIAYRPIASGVTGPARGAAGGWLHFYLGQKRNEWFTFATERRMWRGGSAPRRRAHRHISPSNPRTQ